MQISESLLYKKLVQTIAETNGLTLMNTLDLLAGSQNLPQSLQKVVLDFHSLLNQYTIEKMDVEPLLEHPIGEALFEFFKNFPFRYREEHIHLTGSLSAEFIYPRLKKLLEGPMANIYKEKITQVYGKSALPITSVEDVKRLTSLTEKDQFDRYLELLLISKMILVTRRDHKEAAYHLAESLWNQYNVGAIRLKFTLSRSTQRSSEQVPGLENLTSEDVIMGLYQGFRLFQDKHPNFQFILSPCFRKEWDFFDAEKFKTKREDFNFQTDQLCGFLTENPELSKHILEVDTVGNEKNFYKKCHFQEMKSGLRKLQAKGIKIRSHHGETWLTLRTGIQAVDNAMNIWHLDAVEHGLSLGINPNFYFHSLFQRVMNLNQEGRPLEKDSKEYRELAQMDWEGSKEVRDKIFRGEKLKDSEVVEFVKAKFHLAREVEQYQHDVINRMIDKKLSVISLPSSNKKLTGQFKDYKDHPFSWWEKKGLKLGVGTDNYYTLSTNYIQEMLILLFTDAFHLKIMKLLIVCTGEKRRTLMSQKLWEMRKDCLS